MKARVFQALAHAASRQEPVALGVITGVKGSSPQKLGAKAVFYGDGRIEGTMGGGCLEAEIQRRALETLRTGRATTFDLLLDHDFGWDDGLICGGNVSGIIVPNAQGLGAAFWQDLRDRKRTVHWGIDPNLAISMLRHAQSAQDWPYTELSSPPWNVWIAGAGHIAQAVAPLALELDFTVTVFDDRPALANHALFPAAVMLRSEVWETMLQVEFPNDPAFGLVVTRGHRHDALVLREWIHRPFLFLGMIGSRRKARIIFEHFLEEKIATPEQVHAVACPVGLAIGGTTVMEIAVSIVAQLIQKRSEIQASEPRTGTALRSG